MYMIDYHFNHHAPSQCCLPFIAMFHVFWTVHMPRFYTEHSINYTNYSAFLLSLPWAWQLSWGVLVDAGFVRNKAAVLSAAIKERFFTLIRLLILGSIFQGKVMFVSCSKMYWNESCVSFKNISAATVMEILFFRDMFCTVNYESPESVDILSLTLQASVLCLKMGEI